MIACAHPHWTATEAADVAARRSADVVLLGDAVLDAWTTGASGIGDPSRNQPGIVILMGDGPARIRPGTVRAGSRPT